jgi:hypothetical protein
VSKLIAFAGGIGRWYVSSDLVSSVQLPPLFENPDVKGETVVDVIVIFLLRHKARSLGIFLNVLPDVLYAREK